MSFYIIPDGTIKLLTNVPFDPTYENTMYWESKAEQETWMNNHTTHTLENQSYTRKDKGVIRVELSISATYNVNYLAFRNYSFENKWFYAFVTKAEYVNDHTSNLYFTIDVLNTWYFEYSCNPCFVERVHVSEDDKWTHTIPEKLEHGEYVGVQASFLQDGITNPYGKVGYKCALVLATTFDPDGTMEGGKLIPGRLPANAVGLPSSNMYSGVKYTVFTLDADGVTAINNALSQFTDQAQIDGVLAIFLAPIDATAAFVTSETSSISLEFAVGTSLGSYTPRNNKLFCYPYNFLYATNNQGNYAEYKWEDFANPNRALFEVWGNASADAGLYLFPSDYKESQGYNEDEALSLSGFPLCSWTYDSFKAWLAQNVGTLTARTVNTVENAIIGGVGAYIGASSGSPHMLTQGAQTVFSAAQEALSILGEVYDHSRQPPQANGSTNGSLQYQAGMLTFSFYRKHIKPEYASIIDKYFDMYGYQVNTVRVPPRMAYARPCYTFVKTSACTVEGDLPAEDIAEIERIYNKGIRHWRSTVPFGIYDPAVNDNRPNYQP